jgi:hypothetical protein
MMVAKRVWSFLEAMEFLVSVDAGSSSRTSGVTG